MANTLPYGLQTALPGTRFQPTKIKLVSFYLANKILGLQSETEAAFIPDRNLYGDQEPWEIFKLYAPDSDYYDDGDDDDAVKDVYLFTRLKKISKNRIGRTVGKGTWHAESKADCYEVKVKGKCFDACFRRYSYRNEDSDHHKRWTLLEYSCSALSDDVVICILRKNEDKAVPADAPTPTLKRKSGVCPIATEEPKRMRFEAEIVESSPTNDNTEIIPAIASAVEDHCNTVDQTATFMVPSYNSTVEDVVGSDSNLSNWADSYNGMITDEGWTFANLLLNSDHSSSNISSTECFVESATNYNFEVSPATASGVEEWSVSEIAKLL